MDSIVEALFLTEYRSKLTSLNQIIQEIHSHSEPSDSLAIGWRPPRVSVYTFGCPRLGNAQLSMQIKQKVATAFRVAVSRDIVTMLPKLPFVYSHAGTPVILEADALGSMIVNPTLIEKSFLRNSTGIYGHKDKVMEFIYMILYRKHIQSQFRRVSKLFGSLLRRP